MPFLMKKKGIVFGKGLFRRHGSAPINQAASHEADAARKSIEEIEGKFEAVRKMRKEPWDFFLPCESLPETFTNSALFPFRVRWN